MKIVYSEFQPRHDLYVYPYAIWGLRETNDSLADIYNKGFLPSSKEMDRFYLCRHVRVDLTKFEPSSENRRILKKLDNEIEFKIYDKKDFVMTEDIKKMCLEYAKDAWGKNVMPPGRFDALYYYPITSHVMCFKKKDTKEIVGIVFLLLDDKNFAQYYYAFYQLPYLKGNLGIFMMTKAIKYFAESGFNLAYLGTCYERKALYKTQFKGVEFFNGFRWSDNIKELKYLLDRDKQKNIDVHLLESTFTEQFYGKNIKELV